MATLTIRASRQAHRRGRRPAAICRDLGAILATGNTPDFEETGIELVDPWNSAYPGNRVTDG